MCENGLFNLKNGSVDRLVCGDLGKPSVDTFFDDVVQYGNSAIVGINVGVGLICVLEYAELQPLPAHHRSHCIGVV